MRECVQNQWRRKEGARPPAERERYAIIVKVKGVKKKKKKVSWKNAHEDWM